MIFTDFDKYVIVCLVKFYIALIVIDIIIKSTKKIRKGTKRWEKLTKTKK